VQLTLLEHDFVVVVPVGQALALAAHEYVTVPGPPAPASADVRTVQHVSVGAEQ
jgi:hypothetical protein